MHSLLSYKRLCIMLRILISSMNCIYTQLLTQFLHMNDRNYKKGKGPIAGMHNSCIEYVTDMGFRIHTKQHGWRLIGFIRLP